MESLEEAAREAFDAAAAGKKVGVFTRLDGPMAEALRSHFEDMSVTERLEVEPFRHLGWPADYLELHWRNGGRLYIQPHRDQFRGMTLDRCFAPLIMRDEDYQAVRPTLATSGRMLDVYPVVAGQRVPE